MTLPTQEFYSQMQEQDARSARYAFRDLRDWAINENYKDRRPTTWQIFLALTDNTDGEPVTLSHSLGALERDLLIKALTAYDQGDGRSILQDIIAEDQE